MPRLAREDDAMPASRDHSGIRKTRRVIGRRVGGARALLVVIALVWAGLLYALLPANLSAPVQASALVQTGATNTPSATATHGPNPTSTTAADTPTAPPASTATSAPPAATATSASSQSSGGSQAPTPATTRIDLAQPTLGTSNGDTATTFSPSNLTSNGLAIFTILGCIVGVVGLLAVGVTLITLLSDGWGPMLKAVVRGNRRGKLRFSRKNADRRNAARERTPIAAPRSRGGWR